MDMRGSPIPNSCLAASACCLEHRIEVDRNAGLHVTLGGFEIDLAPSASEERVKNPGEQSILRKLRQSEADELVAHDEIVGLRDFGDLAVSVVEHLAHDVERSPCLIPDLAEMKEGDERPRVCLLDVNHVLVREHDGVVIRRHVE